MKIIEVREMVDRVSHWIPSQGPLKEFVHHNTLHAFQDRPFFEGCLTAARLYGARAFLPLSEYRQLWKQGRITEQAIEEVLKLRQPEASLRDNLRTRLYGLEADEELTKGIARTGLRSRWRDRRIVPLHVRTHAIMFRLAGQFLDQGISMWRMPHADRCSLLECVRRLVKESSFPLIPFSWPNVKGYLELAPEQIIDQILQKFVGDERYYERYLLELSLGHPGWSGLIRQIELQPGMLVLRRNISLAEFLALELLAEFAFVSEALGPKFSPLLDPGEELAPLPIEPSYQLEWTECEEIQSLWHEAFERSSQHGVLKSVQSHGRVGTVERPAAQVFFCIDDRECSLRRHLETVWPEVETLGAAGFFGVDCVFQGSRDAFAFKHCPVPVEPHFMIREESHQHVTNSKGLGGTLASTGPGLLRGFLVSQTLGMIAALRLAWSIFRPSHSPLMASSLRRVDQQADLHILKSDDETCDGYQVGYSEAEMATRVFNLLHNNGVRQVAELVVLLGHGASSVNNPYFAAYDCGACSGKPGSPNSRAMAKMANRPGVRALVAEKGLVIPEGTWFVGGLHDTTRDEVQFFEVDLIPTMLKPLFRKFQEMLELSLARNAKERCVHFALVDPQITPEQALIEVRRRSAAIFEPRPELNHARNWGAIVGQRSLTRGLNLDRRVFLNSYDPELDPEGDILAGILSAVVPVCGGINLEYYFSRLDPAVYGAGSKLPHNVNGLIGVMNGTEGDLLTGLPSQMTEVHETVRLMLLVQAEPEVALKAARKNAGVYEWIENGWVCYHCISSKLELFEFRDHAMVPLGQVEAPRILIGAQA